jgi:hypothetical protein
MKQEQNSVAYDEEKIASISKRIVDEAIRPRALAEYILNYLDDEAGEELPALRTAIDSRYPEFRERFERAERGAASLEYAQSQAKAGNVIPIKSAQQG